MNLTNEQKDYILKREIKIDNIYAFPQFGLTVYENPDRTGRASIDTNPFTKSLGSEFFQVNGILDNGLLKGNFHSKPKSPDFYIDKYDIETRNYVDKMFMYLFVGTFFVIKNLFVGKK